MKSARKTATDQAGRTSGLRREPEAGAGPDTVPAGAEVPAEVGDEADSETAAAPLMGDRLVRLQADFDNYRKRVLREKEDLYRRANEDLMTSLLPVLDHLELALAAAGDRVGTDDPLAEGFRLVGEQLMTVLGKFGLSPIDAGGDVEFDPNRHEAVLHMPSAEVPENGIVSRTRAGYMLGGRLLRAAQVVVSSGAPVAVIADDADA